MKFQSNASLVTQLRSLLCLTSSFALATAFAVRAHAQDAAEPGDDGPDLSAYVSPDLAPGERELMRSVMDTLPAAMKQEIASLAPGTVGLAVVEGGTGVIHYNRTEDVGTYEVVHDFSLPGDERPLAETPANGEAASVLPEASPASAVKDPGVFGGSGPYRRVYTAPLPAAPITQPTNGYLSQYPQKFYEAYGSVALPCSAGSFASDNDVGYAYMGGWSANWNTAHGSGVVDAGLQYSPLLDNYAMFMNIGGVGIIHKGNDAKAIQPPRIQCGRYNGAGMKFWAYGAAQLKSVAPACWIYPGKGVSNNPPHFWGFTRPSCNTYALALGVSSLGFIGPTKLYLIVWFAPNIEDGGWAELLPYTAGQWGVELHVAGWLPIVPCGGCMFKWMTSIGQKPKENLTDGSNFGTAWSQRSITGWPGSRELVPLNKADTFCTEYPLWHDSYPAKHTTDCQDTPSGLAGIQRSVQVGDYSPGGEKDAIDLVY